MVQTQREVEFRENIASFSSFSVFVWRSYYVLATVLGARDTTMNKAKSLFSWSLFLYGRYAVNMHSVQTISH